MFATPEAVPASRAGTLSLAKAKLMMKLPAQNPVSVSNKVSMWIESRREVISTDHSISAVNTPPTYSGFRFPIQSVIALKASVPIAQPTIMVEHRPAACVCVSP